MARDTEWLNMADTLLRAMPSRYDNGTDLLNIDRLEWDVGEVLKACPDAAPEGEPARVRPVFGVEPCGFRP